MTFKTILVHCTGEHNFAHLLEPAIATARRFEAHLTALSVLPPILVEPALVPGGVATIVDNHRKAYEAEQGKMQRLFETRVQEAGINAEWLVADAGHDSTWKKTVTLGRSADLIIVSQADPSWPMSNMMEAPADIVLHAGRPVLVVPNSGHHANFGQRVLIAWNGRRESARAAHDALPFLKAAREVSVLWVNPGGDEIAEDIPGADLCTMLSRHGVNCTADAIERPEQSVAATLLARARFINADLLVMGGYGHSRLREFVLGGATREVLREMHVPVLMSH